jgi:hypothetical protein
MTLPGTLAKTAAAARAWGTVSAADNLADCVCEIIGLAAPKTRRAGDVAVPENGESASGAAAKKEQAA